MEARGWDAPPGLCLNTTRMGYKEGRGNDYLSPLSYGEYDAYLK